MSIENTNSNSDINEIEQIINRNIATDFKTQNLFSQLLIYNGCSKINSDAVGISIRNQLMKEAE